MIEIEDLSSVHIFKCDLARMQKNETASECYSVPMGHPEKGKTVPLFTLEQAKEISEEELTTLRSALAAESEKRENAESYIEKHDNWNDYQTFLNRSLSTNTDNGDCDDK